VNNVTQCATEVLGEWRHVYSKRWNVGKEIHGTIIGKSMENKLTDIRLHRFSRNGTVTSTCATDLVWSNLGHDQLLHTIKGIKWGAINLKSSDLLCIILWRYCRRSIRWFSVIFSMLAKLSRCLVWSYKKLLWVSVCVCVCACVCVCVCVTCDACVCDTCWARSLNTTSLPQVQPVDIFYGHTWRLGRWLLGDNVGTTLLGMKWKIYNQMQYVLNFE